MIKRKKYYNLETDLLFHKYRYYELNDPVITDYEYDMLEKEARNISTIMDSISSVHSMVGFTKNHRLWNKVKEKYNIK